MWSVCVCGEGGEWGANPSSQQCNYGLHLNPVGFCGSLSRSLPLRRSLYFSSEANSHSRSNFYGT